jgi:hypothetical protein
MSHHLTVSTYQRTSYTDLFKRLLPNALQSCFEGDVRFREGLAIDYARFFGSAFSGDDSNGSGGGNGERQRLDRLCDRLNMRVTSLPVAITHSRESFEDRIRSLLETLMERMDLDSAADELQQDFIEHRLPPFVLSTVPSSSSSVASTSITLHSRIRLLHVRWFRMRLFKSDFGEPLVELRTCIFNNRALNMLTPDSIGRAKLTLRNSVLRFPGTHAAALEVLFQGTDVRVSDLPALNDSTRLAFTEQLNRAGFVTVKNAMK